MTASGAGKLSLLCGALLLVVITVADVSGDRSAGPFVSLAVGLLMLSVVALAVVIALSPDGTLDSPGDGDSDGSDDDSDDEDEHDYSLL